MWVQFLALEIPHAVDEAKKKKKNKKPKKTKQTHTHKTVLYQYQLPGLILYYGHVRCRCWRKLRKGNATVFATSSEMIIVRK